MCWLHPRPLEAGRKYLLKHTTQTVQAAVTAIEHRINITNLNPESGAQELAMNDIGEVRIATSGPVVFDGYAANRLTGSFILIEPGTNTTVGAGMLFHPTEVAKPEYRDFVI
jgi:bifunctional enzyme CysN/CysC/sulfate adenylyltransferase subunit 1